VYVREKRISRGEKTYSYWQVVEGRRVDGKVRQSVVAHLGACEDRTQADTRARLKGFLCGVPKCGEAATCELEYRGFRPTHTLEMPSGGALEFPYRVCPEHLEAYRRGELGGVWPFIGK
jgi:hypothetical protein